MKETRDIQLELFKLCSGMDSYNIYSQLTYFLIEIAVGEQNPRKSGTELATIMGLLADSYWGFIACDKISELKDEVAK